jgi:tetratricopeptide (TPR) repeat protein
MDMEGKTTMSDTPLPVVPESRPRPWVVALLVVGAVLLLLAVVVPMQTWWFQRQAARRDAGMRAAIQTALDEANLALREDRIEAAIATLHEALTVLDKGAPEHLRADLERFAQDLVWLKELEHGIRERWRIDQLAERNVARRRGNLQQLEWEALNDPGSVAARMRNSRATSRLLRILDERFVVAWHPSERMALEAVLKELNDDPQCMEARTARMDDNPAQVRAVAGQINPETLSARLALLLGSNQNLRLSDRVRLLRRARVLFPDDVPVAVMLAWALAEQDSGLQPADAADLVPCFRTAAARFPQSPAAWANLGVVLLRKGDAAEALVAYRKAYNLGASDPRILFELAFALLEQNAIDEAIATFRLVEDGRPAIGSVYPYLGWLLRSRGDIDGASEAFLQASTHPHVGTLSELQSARILLARDLPEQAIVAFRRVLVSEPGNLSARASLIGVFQRKGDSVQAHAYLPAPRTVREELTRESLAARLPRVLEGAEDLTPAECAAFARFCLAGVCRFGDALELYNRAFADDPGLMASHRVDAARAAILVADGDGIQLPDVATRAALRRQALQWLRADLVDASKVDRSRVAAWVDDPSFATVRAPEALVVLSKEERQAWRQFWDEVRRKAAPWLP